MKGVKAWCPMWDDGYLEVERMVELRRNLTHLPRMNWKPVKVLVTPVARKARK